MLTREVRHSSEKREAESEATASRPSARVRQQQAVAAAGSRASPGTDVGLIESQQGLGIGIHGCIQRVQAPPAGIAGRQAVGQGRPQQFPREVPPLAPAAAANGRGTGSACHPTLCCARLHAATVAVRLLCRAPSAIQLRTQQPPPAPLICIRPSHHHPAAAPHGETPPSARPLPQPRPWGHSVQPGQLAGPKSQGSRSTAGRRRLQAGRHGRRRRSTTHEPQTIGTKSVPSCWLSVMVSLLAGSGAVPLRRMKERLHIIGLSLCRASKTHH